MFSKMASNPAIPTRSSPSSSTRKREPQPQPDPPSKKLKQSPSVSKPRNAPSRDQKSLRGYFQPSASTKTPTNEPEQDVANPPGAKNETPPTTDQMLNAEIEEGGKTAPKSSRANWSKIFAKPAPPLCEGHSEECIQLTAKKPGPNCGRAFWACQRYDHAIFVFIAMTNEAFAYRPIGPRGEQEVKSGQKTDWKCNFFKWASDL